MIVTIFDVAEGPKLTNEYTDAVTCHRCYCSAREDLLINLVTGLNFLLEQQSIVRRATVEPLRKVFFLVTCLPFTAQNLQRIRSVGEA